MNSRTPLRPLGRMGAATATALLLVAPAHAQAGSAPQQTVRCPSNVVTFPRHGALRQAERAALEQAPKTYKGLNLRGRRATSAYIVRRGTRRSADAGRCHLDGRTILVEMQFPGELPSSSLSEAAVYVSLVKPPRQTARWLLWAAEH